VPVALVTAVGPDPLGMRLRDQLVAEGVDVSGLQVRNERRTGVTLVEVDAAGERRFFGFRENSADLATTVADIERPVVKRLIAGATILHSGTVSLASDSARAATLELQAAARSVGALVSVDVNLRPGMYASAELLLQRATEAVASADIVKATIDEAMFLEGTKRRPAPRRAADAVLARGPSLVLLTDGDKPMYAATKNAWVELEALTTKMVDATGAGDAFMGAALAALFALGVDASGVPALSAQQLLHILRDARRAGAAAVTGLGATTKMIRRRQPRRAAT
jgi:fructokinase